MRPANLKLFGLSALQSSSYRSSQAFSSQRFYFHFTNVNNFLFQMMKRTTTTTATAATTAMAATVITATTATTATTTTTTTMKSRSQQKLESVRGNICSWAICFYSHVRERRPLIKIAEFVSIIFQLWSGNKFNLSPYISFESFVLFLEPKFFSVRLFLSLSTWSKNKKIL